MSSQQQVVRNETESTLRKPWTLSAIFGATVTVIFLIEAVSGGWHLGDLTAAPALRSLSLVPDKVADGELWRLFTANLLYSSIWSLLASLLTLALIGSVVEARWGARRFLASGLIACLGSTLPVVLLEPTVSRWATGNGAVLALVGAALVVAKPAGYNRITIAAVALIDIIVYLRLTPESSVWSPLGGIASGALIAALLRAAPEDERRNRVQAMLLGGLFGVLCLVALVVVVVR